MIGSNFVVCGANAFKADDAVKPPVKINLHVHSDASDGALSPNEVVDAMTAAGVQLFALTDHNTVAGIEEAQRQAAKNGVAFVPGVELTAELPFDPHVYAHILGLGVDANELYEPLQAEKKARVAALNRVIERARLAGYNLFPDEIYPLLWSTAVVAKELIFRGYAAGETDAFAIAERFGGKDVPRFLTVPETAARIHRAGGIAVFAHPFDLVGVVKQRIGAQETAAMFDTSFRQADGIEVFYQDYDEAQIGFLNRFADERGLLKSAGTDFHALSKHGFPATGRKKLWFEKNGISADASVLSRIDRNGRAILNL